MRKNQYILAITLALIVMLPLALLAWQSWRMQQDSLQVQQAQLASLATLRLEQVDNRIQGYFDEMARQLAAQSSSPGIVERLQQQVRTDGRIRLFFVFDTQRRQRVYPLSDAVLTAREQAFVSRWQAIWNDPQILSVKQTAALTEEAALLNAKRNTVSKISSRSKAGIDAVRATQQGWYTHYWGKGISLLFWRQLADGRLVGVELEPARVKADVISLLPDTLSEGSEDYRIRLLDTAEQVVYQWGNHLPDKQQVLQSHSLSYPLSSWSLDYYGDSASVGFGRYSLLLSFAGLALVVLGLAWFLYREQTREMRLAAQRVQFVSQVSHELKTPLTNVRMYAEMLEDQLDDEPQQQHYLRVIVDESGRLTRLINNVLNFARQPRLHKRAVSVNEIIRQVVEHCRPGFQTRGITIELDLQAEGKLYSDPDVLEQILNNLLSNAEKYAAQGKHVHVSSHEVAGWVHISVRDFGAGISRRERKRIFQPFYRISNSLTEGVSGTGIGLTIARQQAEALGGRLALREVTPGACFELVLPLDSVDNNVGNKVDNKGTQGA